MHAQDAGNPQQRRNPHIGGPVFDLLVGGAGEAGGEVDALLGHVLVDAPDADAVADGLALLEEPVVVVGQPGHPIDTRPLMILSLPGIPGIS